MGIVQLCRHILSLMLSPEELLMRCVSLYKGLQAAILGKETRMPAGFIVRAIHGEPPHRTALLSLSVDNKKIKSKSQQFSLELPGGDDGVRIVASTNGLLLCVREGPDRSIEEDCYLYNPCTKEYVVIPRPSRCHPKGARMLRMGIAFDPTACCDTDVASYTIVNAFEIQSCGGTTWRQFGFEIYSSSSPGAWRISEEVTEAYKVYSPLRTLACQTGALFYDSLLYWPLTSGYLLTFDVATETPGWGGVTCYSTSAYDVHDYAVHRCAGWLGEHQGRLVFAKIMHPITGIDGEFNIRQKIRVPPYYWRSWHPDHEGGPEDKLEDLVFDLRDELLIKNPRLADMLGLDDGLCHDSTHIFRPVGMARSGDSDVVLLVTPCGRTFGFYIQSRTFELLMDVLHPSGANYPLIPPYSLAPAYFPYSPTTIRLSACLK